jgi:hypothetical protein
MSPGALGVAAFRIVKFEISTATRKTCGEYALWVRRQLAAWAYRVCQLTMRLRMRFARFGRFRCSTKSRKLVARKELMR